MAPAAGGTQIEAKSLKLMLGSHIAGRGQVLELSYCFSQAVTRELDQKRSVNRPVSMWAAS